ncbi:MAG: hypothetical protein K9I99_03765 [Melioribacteraceae bacterium]|nr:hypothetical protein [Melioribacteraceae bacterium]
MEVSGYEIIDLTSWEEGEVFQGRTNNEKTKGLVKKLNVDLDDEYRKIQDGEILSFHPYPSNIDHVVHEADPENEIEEQVHTFTSIYDEIKKSEWVSEEE